MTVKVDLPNFANLSELAVERATNRVTARVQEEAVMKAPVKTGEYRRKIVADFNKDEVRAEAKHSEALEYGTAPHTITAKNAKALKFTSGGQTVFAKSVNHPGTKPQPTMRMAARTVQREVPKIFKEEFNKAKG